VVRAPGDLPGVRGDSPAASGRPARQPGRGSRRGRGGSAVPAGQPRPGRSRVGRLPPPRRHPAATHYLEEADALCDRVLVIDHGKIVAAGTPEELKRHISGDVITLSVSGDPGTARGLLAGQPGVRDISLDGRSLRLAVEQGEEALPGLLRALDGAGIAMESIQLARPSLDDVFLTVTGRSLRDDSTPAQREPVAAGR